MNIFDDLIVELKEENLIESSVANGSSTANGELGIQDLLDLDGLKVENCKAPADELLETERFLQHLEAAEDVPVKKVEIETPNMNDGDVLEIEPKTNSLPREHLSSNQAHNEPLELQPKRKISGFELFRKRAMEEVSALQMADNIFSNVEREQIKISPRPYNDMLVKRVLHSFVQLPAEISLEQQTQAEFELRHETEIWHTALAERDAEISVDNLRYCCESTRPPLSPPAMLALARFYRNSQFSESVRNKFDLIVTRLFSRDIEFNRRELVFSRAELIGHFKDLYAEWESIPFYPLDETAKEIVGTVLRFEDLIAEAKRAKKFDELIGSDFFNRVRALKRNTEELFYAPQVAAVVIICNVEIGNRYLDLIDVEQENSSNSDIEEKYGLIYDQAVSDATNKSVKLAQLLSQPRAKAKLIDLGIIDPNSLATKRKVKKSRFGSILSGFSIGINKWVLALAVVTCLLTAGLVVWVEFLSVPKKQTSDVKTVRFENSPFKQFIESARVNDEKLYVITTVEWEETPREKREEILGKIFAAGQQKGYKTIQLFNQKGETIGSATPKGIQLK